MAAAKGSEEIKFANNNNDACIVGYARTPCGAFGGALASFTAPKVCNFTSMYACMYACRYICTRFLISSKLKTRGALFFSQLGAIAIKAAVKRAGIDSMVWFIPSWEINAGVDMTL